MGQYTEEELRSLYVDPLKQARDRIAELEAELADYHTLIKMQHRRTLVADQMWQAAHNEPDMLPDLGELIDWLLAQIAELKAKQPKGVL